MKLPTIKSIAACLRALKLTICNENRASEDPEDTTPGMCVTIGADEQGSWSFQTGDNSFSGGAYGMPYRGVIYLYRRSNCRALARDAIDQIAELQCQ